MTEQTPILAAFGVPNYRRFIGGQAISLIGSWTETIAPVALGAIACFLAVAAGLIVTRRFHHQVGAGAPAG